MVLATESGISYLANRPHTDNPQSETRGIAPRHEIRRRSPRPAAGALLGHGRIPQRRQNEKHSHIGRGLGDGVDRVAEIHAPRRHPLDVELVEAGAGRGDNAAAGREGLEQVLVERLVRRRAHADDEGVDGAVLLDVRGQHGLRLGPVRCGQDRVLEFLSEFGQVVAPDVFGLAQTHDAGLSCDGHD